MSKHLELFDLLPVEARPDTGGVLASSHRDILVEHAAIVWLMGRAAEQGTELTVSCHSLNGGQYQVAIGRFNAFMGGTLVEALMDAVRNGVGDD